MTIFFHELRQNLRSTLIWSAVLALLMVMYVALYPEMQASMEEMTDMLAEMGALSQAFGMDTLDMGRFEDYFAVEVGNTVGIAGALFAALLGIGLLAKEERLHTADFLLSHPVSRRRVVAQKGLAALCQVLILNAIMLAACFLSLWAVGIECEARKMLLLTLPLVLMQVEILALCFGLSAFGAGTGLGIGVAAAAYVLNILGNLVEGSEPLKYLTPFAYCEGSYILEHNALHPTYLLIGLALTAAGIVAAFLKFTKKDIR